MPCSKKVLSLTDRKEYGEWMRWYAQNSENIPQEFVKEFEERHGPTTACHEAPFLSYLFRRVIRKEKDPQEFFGREVFTLYKKFLKKHPNLEGIARTAYFERPRGFIFMDYKNLQEDISDGLPRSVEEFERLRKKLGPTGAIVRMHSPRTLSEALEEEDHRLF